VKDAVLLAITSPPKYLSVVRAATGRMAELFGMTQGEIEDVRLGVDEACANVIRHAYKGRTDQKIVIRYRIKKGSLEVIIEDNGAKADSELIRGRDLDDIRPGGLGVHLIRRAFDIFAFDERKEKGNRLRLVRHRKEKDGD
jgi:anti-sigma regulatory factor (Ser/Thr protein kinase)